MSTSRFTLPSALPTTCYLLLVLCLCFPAAQTQASFKAVEGHLDLRQWDLEEAVSLDGQWQLQLFPQQRKPSSSGEAARLTPVINRQVEVPMLWRRLPLSPPVSGLGRGTYYLKLQLPTTDLPLALQLPKLSAATELRLKYNHQWHTPIAMQQDYAGDARYRLPLVILPAGVADLEMEIEILSNFSSNGGLEHAPVIAPLDELQRLQQQPKILATAISAVLLAFALVNLILWSGRRNDLTVLMLSVLAITVSGRIFIIDSDAIYDFLPRFTVAQNTYIGWITFLISPMVAAIYFFLNYRKVIGLAPLIGILATSLVTVGLLLFADIPTLQRYADIHRPLIAALTLWVNAKLLFSLWRGNRRVMASAIAASLVMVGFAVETVHFQLYGVTSPFMAFGLGWLAFLAIETLSVSNRFQRSLERVDELTDENQTLSKMANRDALTGLANRRAFDARCLHEYNRHVSNGSEQRLAMMFIDLDHFKLVNDRFGHDAGDAVLKTVATLLQQSLRKNDFVARLGGEEFCLLLPNSNIDNLPIMAQRILDTIEAARTTTQGQSIKVTASIGISLLSEQPLLELLREADQALYHSKHRGRNRFTCYWLMEESKTVTNES